MIRTSFLFLLFAYFSYSFMVYSLGTDNPARPNPWVKAGQDTWQKYNCQACHQLYGLGGYMGPDLTNIISNPGKGPVYAEAFIQAGTARMPKFQLSKPELKSLLAFLAWVDTSGNATVPASKVTWYGSYDLNP